MFKFLLVSARSGEDILGSEYRDFLMATKLNRSQLDHVVLDSLTARRPDVSGYQGIFIGGSPFNISDAHYSDVQVYVHQQLLSLLDRSIPKMFVCFGSSLLSHSLGGSVSRAFAEDAGPTIVELTGAGRTDPLLRGLPQRFEALTGHTENVEKLPAKATLLATGPTCPAQMYRLPGETWACQFHAEMDPLGMENRMRFYLDYGYFDPAEFDRIVERIHRMDTRYANRILANFVAYCAAKSSK